MNSSIRQTFAIPAACSPVNELLTAIMRSFNEQPEQPHEDRAKDLETTGPLTTGPRDQDTTDR